MTGPARDVHQVTTARCLSEGCGWAVTGPWEATDRAADKHTRQLGHVTSCLTARYPTDPR